MPDEVGVISFKQRLLHVPGTVGLAPAGCVDSTAAFVFGCWSLAYDTGFGIFSGVLGPFQNAHE